MDATLLPRILMFASAAAVGLLGAAHLRITYSGTGLWPRPLEVQQAMAGARLGLTGETTVWSAWVGFNASHSSAALLFALIYGWFALAQPGTLFRSPYLLLVGLAMLAAWLVLARLYWFSVPFQGVAMAAACYVAAVGFAFAGTAFPE